MCYLIVLILSLFVFQTGNAKNPIAKAKPYQPFFKAISSTNNTRVYLNKLNLPAEVKNQFVNVLKGSKNKNFQARKLSKSAFSVKLSNGKWARFDLSPAEGLLIGKKKFKWNFSQSVKINLSKISQILRSEYSQKKAMNSFSLLIPSAQADASLIYDQDAVIVGGTGALVQSAYQANQFLHYAEAYCETGAYPTNVSVDNFLNGDLLNPRENPYENREWVRRRFFEIRNHFVEYTWGEYLFFPNFRYTNSAFNRFYKVQKCFRDKRYISSSEMREHPVNRAPVSQGVSN